MKFKTFSLFLLKSIEIIYKGQEACASLLSTLLLWTYEINHNICLTFFIVNNWNKVI